MTTAERSDAFREVCRRSHGLPFVQFNAVDAAQFDHLATVLQLAPGARILDLGCGIGTVTEYFCDRLGASGTGLDLSDRAISRATERTGGGLGQLTFRRGDMEALELPPDAFDLATFFDTLYFVRDIESMVATVGRALTPGGRIAAFYSAIQKTDETDTVLRPDETRVARAFTSLGWPFSRWEFTDHDLRYWAASLEATETLRGQFEAEGNTALYTSRLHETHLILDAHRQRRIRRYLYLATPSSR